MMPSTACRYKFGDFVLSPGEHLLVRGDAHIRLRPKTFQALVYLVERQGRLVKKEELLDDLWLGTIVTENTLSRCINELRQALGDNAQTPVFIQTVPRLGFKFIAAVERIPEAPAAAGMGEEGGFSAPQASRTPISRWRWFVGTAVLIVAAVVVYAGWLIQHRSEAPVFPSIAVLPFTDMSENQDQEYFCNGMTEELITRLSRMPALKVIARTSVMRYKNSEKSIKEIGAELQVATVLEGSVRKEGDDIRVNAQLINVADESHLWAQSYNKKLASVFELQDDVSQAIGQALQGTLAPAKRSALASTPHKNTEAYEYYLKGRYQLYSKYARSGHENDFQNAVKMFQKAIAIDSNYALAYVGLAHTYHMQWVYSGFQSRQALDLKFNYAKQAVTLDSTLAEAQDMLASSYLTRLDFERSYRALRKALHLNPNLADANFTAAHFMQNLGLFEKSADYFNRVLALDPYDMRVYGLQADFLIRLGKLEEAAGQLQRGAEIEPEFLGLYNGYAHLALLEKKYDRADSLLAKAEKISPGIAAPFRAMLLAARGEKEKALALSDEAEIYAVLGMKEEMIKKLQERKDQARSYYLILRHYPVYSDFQNDPQFREVLHHEKRKYEQNLRKYGDLQLERNR